MSFRRIEKFRFTARILTILVFAAPIFFHSQTFASLPQLDNIPERAIPIKDDDGRHVIYRGINARVEGLFDVSFSDGRLPLEKIPALTDADLIEMKKIGFNFIRLPLSWSGIAPKPNQYSKTYIANVLKTLDLCQKYGIKVMLDMHQDAYSKEIGEDGAPDWAIYPRNFDRNEGGHLGNLTLKRISLDTQRAFASFWKNKWIKGRRIWDHYVEAILFLLEGTADHPAVAGLQIMNEPWLIHIKKMYGDDIYTEGVHIGLLWDFYTYTVKKIRKRHKDLWLYIEPDVSKSAAVPFLTKDDELFKATGLPKKAPWKTHNTVYAPHLYTLGMVLDGFLGSKLDPEDPGIKTSIEYSMVEAEQVKAPMMIGEFGFSNRSKYYKQTLHNIYDFADKYMFHTAQWVWKETSQGSWGFWDYDEDTKTYHLREKAARNSARAYPSRVSGEMKSFNLDANSKTLTINLLKSGKEIHEIVWPVSYGYSKTPTVMCGSKPIEYEITSFGDITFNCREKEITIKN